MRILDLFYLGIAQNLCRKFTGLCIENNVDYMKGKTRPTTDQKSPIVANRLEFLFISFLWSFTLKWCTSSYDGLATNVEKNSTLSLHWSAILKMFIRGYVIGNSPSLSYIFCLDICIFDTFASTHCFHIFFFTSCPHCDKIFTAKPSLKCHIDAVHRSIKHYCSICNQRYGPMLNGSNSIFVATKFHFGETITLAGLVSSMLFVPHFWKLCDGITFVELHFWDLVRCILISFCFGSEILETSSIRTTMRPMNVRMLESTWIYLN